MTLPSLRTTLFLVCLPLLLGCIDPTSPRDELDDARRRWEAIRPSAYSYVISRSCECLPEYTRAARLQVVNSDVTSARYIHDNSQVPANIVATYPTIDDLFVMIGQALERNPKPDILVVHYDPRLGYPTRFELDPDVDVGDDERTIHASDLTWFQALRGSP